MAKYLVETYYTCTFKVNHYLDDINENEMKNLEKRDHGKFEVLDVKIGESINFTAWMNISYDEISQTMFFIEGPTLSIEARSIRDPRIIYEKSITEDKDLFQENFDNVNNEDESSIIIEFFKVWQTVIISLVVIIFGSIGVVKAIQYRLEQDRERLGLPSEEDTPTAGEWMSKFMKKTEMKIFIESETIDSKGFESFKYCVIKIVITSVSVCDLNLNPLFSRFFFNSSEFSIIPL